MVLGSSPVAVTKKYIQFFLGFLKSTSNCKHFQKKDEPHSWHISEIRQSGKCCYLNVLKGSFWNTFRQSYYSVPNTTEIWNVALLSNVWPIWEKFSLKISLLVIFQILGLFFKRLTSDDKHSLGKKENLLQRI